MKKFNEFNWHDSVIRNIMIDRKLPGRRDQIKIDLEWTDGKTNILIFDNVYDAKLSLNFGIECEESIYCAHVKDKESEEVKELLKKWKGTLNHLNLCLFTIELNSTCSMINIIAADFKIQ